MKNHSSLQKLCTKIDDPFSLKLGQSLMNEPKMDKEILQLCESFWQFQLDESPELYKGYHTGNDKLDEFTTAAYERRKVTKKLILVDFTFTFSCKGKGNNLPRRSTNLLVVCKQKITRTV